MVVASDSVPSQDARVPGEGGKPVAIHPFRGAAGIAFGTARAEVRARLGPPSVSYRAPVWSDQLCDQYADTGLKFGYGDSGTVDQVELSAPARAEVDGIGLFDASSRALLTALADIGLETRERPGSWEVPAWGVALTVPGEHIGDRPFDTATAFAHGPTPDPEQFSGPAPEPRITGTVYPRGAGPVRLGMPRDRIRALLGQGMTATAPGRDPVDFHVLARVAVTYDAADAARRICVMTAGARVADTGAGVGSTYQDSVTALREAGVPYEEREAEILLTGLGIRLLVSKAGDTSLPVSGIVVRRAPAL